MLATSIKSCTGATLACSRRTKAPAHARRPRLATEAFSSRSSPLLLSLENSASSGHANVYSSPLKPEELADFWTLLEHRERVQCSDASTEILHDSLLSFLQAAAESQQQDLSLVHGAMVLMEQLYLMKHGTQHKGVLSPEEVHSRRWQLVVGADTGAVQYIPVVEELQIAEDGTSFTLDGDLTPLVGLFMSFNGDSSWHPSGKLLYHVRRVRIELRRPVDLARSLKAWKAGAGATEVSTACSPDFDAPAATLPLPFFPPNELHIFASNGRVACSRSKLGGLILLLNKLV